MDFTKLSARIRQYREMRNYTQEYVAGELGIAQNTYSRLERNPEKFTIKRLNQLLGMLEFDWRMLLEDLFSHHLSA